jgi:anti-anti-sigma factor
VLASVEEGLASALSPWGLMERRRGPRNDVVFRDRQLVITRTFRPHGLRLVGSVDASNVDRLHEVLNGPPGKDGDGHELHLDLTRLEFSDVSGIRALVSAAERADGRYRMVLHGLPPLMGRVMRVVGWSEMPSLEISQDGFPADVELLDGEPHS